MTMPPRGIAPPPSDSPSGATLLLTPPLALALALATRPDASPARLAVLLLWAPWLEEIVFRRGLQQGLQDRLGPGPVAAGAAMGLTAIAFTAAHLLFNPAPWAAWTLLPALALGGLYRATGRVGPCVALHALFNLIWIAATARPASL